MQAAVQNDKNTWRMQLSVSENESESTGLKVGRSQHLHDFNHQLALQKIVAGGFDIVKAKVNALQSTIFDELNALGFPYFVNSILYRNEVHYKNEAPPAIPTGFSYEVFSPVNQEAFLRLIDAIFNRPTGINYANRLYHTLINHNREIEAVRKYYMGFDATLQSSKIAWLLKRNDNYIGFVCGEFSNNAFEGLWYGIHPDYREQGLSNILINIIHRECHARGVKHFFNDVQYQNIPSQLNVMKQSAIPCESYLNVFIMPLLSMSKSKGRIVKNDEGFTIQRLFANMIAEEGGRFADYKLTLLEPGSSNTLPTHLTNLEIGDKKVRLCNFFNEGTLVAVAQFY
jgi:hypothetical protein